MSTQEIINENQPSLNQQDHEVTTTTGRSYDCGFCKRGFTNAQALGGHMNIHRKDRAKIKANKQRTIQNFDFHRVSFVDLNPTSCYLAPLVEYRVYLPCSSNPSFQERNICQQQQYLEEDMDVNLGLRIGGRVRGGDLLENEVDLELRLGYI